MAEDDQQSESPDRKLSATLKDLERLAESLKDFPERTERTMASLFEDSDSYLSKFIAIGYASFFAIWALVRQDMTPGQIFLTAVFMLISVTLYVFNEIVNAIHLNALSENWSKADANGNLQDRFDRFGDFSKRVTDQAKKYGRIRPFIFRLTLLFALLAVGTMLFALVADLWAAYVVDPRIVKS